MEGLVVIDCYTQVVNGFNYKLTIWYTKNGTKTQMIIYKTLQN